MDSNNIHVQRKGVQDRATAGKPSNSRVVASHDGRPPFSSVSNEQAEKLFQAAFSGRGVDEMLDQELARFNIKPGQLKILPLTTCCIWSSIVCIIHLDNLFKAFVMAHILIGERKLEGAPK